MNEKPRSKWYWRFLRWNLIGVAVLLTLAAMLVTEENWRTKRAWENYRQQAEARGEIMDWAAYAKRNIPEDQNFAKAPIFSTLYGRQWDQAHYEEDPFHMYPYGNHTGPDTGYGNWSRAQLTHLEEFQNYYRRPGTNVADNFPMASQPQTPAADVLLALSKFDRAVEGWREANRRPFSRIGIADVNNSPDFSLMLEYLASFKRCAQLLQLRIIAELADHQEARALEDERLFLSLPDKLQQEPMLVADLVSMAINSMTIQPIYEGLVQHRWNDAQLNELEILLAAKDFLAEYQRAMRGERAYAIASEENRRITRQYQTFMDNGTGKPETLIVSLRGVPDAFFYGTELAFARVHEQFILPLVDLTNRVISPAAEKQTEMAVAGQFKHPGFYQIEPALASPTLIKSVKKFAVLQSSMDLARVACALERFRLAHGGYPETLDALAPQYIAKLPHDIINAEPLHYRRTDGGNFILYSVGWNEKDDGGQIAFTKGGTVDPWNGDWVWNSAAQ